MKKKFALVLVCVVAVIAIIAVAWIMREKEQPIDPHFPKEVDTVPSGFSHIDSVLEEYDLNYVFWETQISILDKANVCIYQTDTSDSLFIVECDGEYYINESIIENTADINVTELAVTTVPVETTERVKEELTVEPSSVETVDALPAGTEAALLEGGPVGGLPRFYTFDEGLTYYVSELGNYDDLTSRKFSECKLSLPKGYENGKIVMLSGGGGSGEAFIEVEALRGGETVYLEYYFYCDNIATPLRVSELDYCPLDIR
ncbi:MAG: hypothetical protein IJ002_08865 [Clostridia bacterium]|nr:hypothetical protein [Clostridia bacterium]